MQFQNFNTIPCDIILKNKDIEGTITKDGVTAFMCYPILNDGTESAHLSSDELNLQYIVEQVNKFPDTQIFAQINKERTELTINQEGLIIPKT